MMTPGDNDRNDNFNQVDTDHSGEAERSGSFVGVTGGNRVGTKTVSLGNSSRKDSNRGKVTTRGSIPLPGQVFSPSSPRRYSGASAAFKPRMSGFGGSLEAATRDTPTSTPIFEKRGSNSSIPLPGSIFGGVQPIKTTTSSTAASNDLQSSKISATIDESDIPSDRKDEDRSTCNEEEVANGERSSSQSSFKNTVDPKKSALAIPDSQSTTRDFRQPHMFGSMITNSLSSLQGRTIEFYSEEMASMYESIAEEYIKGNNYAGNLRASLLAYTTSIRIRRYLNRHENIPCISDVMRRLIRKDGAILDEKIGTKKEKFLLGEIDQMSPFLYGILKQDDDMLIVDDCEAVQDYHDKVNQSIALEVYGQARYKEGNYTEAQKAYLLAIRMEHAYFGSDTPTLANLKNNLCRIPGIKDGDYYTDVEHVDDESDYESVNAKANEAPAEKEEGSQNNNFGIKDGDDESIENLESRSSRITSGGELEEEQNEQLEIQERSLSCSRTGDGGEEEKQTEYVDYSINEPLLTESPDVSFFSDLPPSLTSSTNERDLSSSNTPPLLASVPPRYHPLIWIAIGFLLAHIPTILDALSIASRGIESKLNQVVLADPVVTPPGWNAALSQSSKKDSDIGLIGIMGRGQKR